MEELWQRVSRGKHSALLGRLTPEPPSELNLRVVRVSCDGPATALGPLMEAARKVEQILGGPVPLLDQARQRVVSGLRRRLLGDVPATGPDGTLVETLNRLATESEKKPVLVFDAVDAADEATLEALRQIVLRSGWLKLPLVLSFRSRSPSSGAHTLLEAIRVTEGEDAVLGGDPAEAARADEAPPTHVDWRALPPDVLRVLRAGAVVGSGFEAELIAALLRKEPLDVLDCIQRAADAGVPIDDRGEGRFYLHEGHVDALRSSVLPSVARAWHRVLAAILSGESSIGPQSSPRSMAMAAPSSPPSPSQPPAAKAPPPEPSRPSMPSSGAIDASAPPATNEIGAPTDGLDRPSREELQPAAAAPPRPQPMSAPPHSPSTPDSGGSAETTQLQWPYAEIFARESGEFPPGEAGAAPDDGSEDASLGHVPDDATSAASAGPVIASVAANDVPAAAAERPSFPSRADSPVPPEPSAPWSFDAARQRREGPRSIPTKGASGNGGRAASHLSAAGEVEAAAAQFMTAALQASEVGATAQAFAYTQKALALLDELPSSPKRRRLRARLLAELGRLQWLSAGPDVSFTLAGALDVLTQARALLREDDPPELWAEIERMIAGVCYDIGDLKSLERALDALTHASRVLLQSGNAAAAARMLNDQAAVYVRMGDPVRATHLLSESRKIFEEKAASDPTAMLELAETDHLFARIPLHVAARPGRESDALLMGLDHAIAAERTYKKVGARRELGRVWETMGRLELKRGRLERAAERLSAAMQIQEGIGDVLGLARTTAALSEVLAASGRYREAFAVLGDSVALNLEKGSPIGLAFNRRALDALSRSAPAGAGVDEALKEVAGRLVDAESVLGRIVLPGERG